MAVKYKYIPNYQDMRGGYDKFEGVLPIYVLEWKYLSGYAFMPSWHQKA